MWITALSAVVYISGIFVIKGVADYNTVKDGEEPNWTEDGDDIPMLFFWPIILACFLIFAPIFLLFSACAKYAKNILGWPSKTITNKLLKRHERKLLPLAQVKKEK